MKLRIGDKVRFLNETGEGVVSRMKDKLTVFVEMPDGFEIPYLASQLVPIHTELIIDKDADNIELNPEGYVNDAIYLIIEPDHELTALVNDYKIYLYNSSSFNILFSYSIKDEEYFQTLKHGDLGAYQKILLKQVKIQFFKDYNYHKIECLFYKNIHFKTQMPVVEIVNVSHKTLAESKLIKHDEFKFPVYGFLLKDEFITQANVEQELSLIDIAKLKSIKEFNSRSKISKSNKEYLRSLEKEVDLHITELIENPEGLSNFEMLNIQLERFENELDAAITKNMKKLVFIHGVGNGRLKQEIIERLKKTKGVTYQDGSYKDYGFGATQVNIL
ncbi:MAG: Smr/MutS family protein [Bacteroidetes bacterium]|nr:Smr/MutS family protein [Bacteroidota bacterium]